MPRDTATDLITITTERKAINVLKHILADGRTHALDMETTMISNFAYETPEICTMQISGPTGRYFFDILETGFWKLAPLVEQIPLWVFNSGFEGRLLAANGAPDANLLDIGYLRRCIIKGGIFSLAEMAAWDLKITMDKTLQASNWKQRPLTQAQIDYAMLDADVTMELGDYWLDRATDAHLDGFERVNAAWRPTAEMEDAGVRFDSKHHRSVITDYEQKRDAAFDRIREMVTEDEVENVRSDTQWGKFFEAALPEGWIKVWPRTETGKLSMAKADLEIILATAPDPLVQLLNALMDYRKATKFLESFGDTLVRRAEDEHGKKIFCRFNMMAAITGRYSSSRPNLQQIPRGKEIRRSFIADLGRKFVIADYSSIEVRVLAELSGDEALKADVLKGKPHDMHTYFASVALKKPVADVAPDERSWAKAITFSILYGAGAAGLAGQLRRGQPDLTVDQVQVIIDAWQAKYPQAYDYRYTVQETARRTGYIYLPSGRSIYCGKNVSLSRAANFPVQGMAADLMYEALVNIYDVLDTRRREGTLSEHCRMTMVVHDEVVVRCKKAEAAEVERIVVDGMTAAWQNLFPSASTSGLVESAIGDTWADKA